MKCHLTERTPCCKPTSNTLPNAPRSASPRCRCRAKQTAELIELIKAAAGQGRSLPAGPADATACRRAWTTRPR